MYVCFHLPAIQVDLARVQLDILLFIKDAVDDGLQHLVQIWHANSLPAKQQQQQPKHHTSISVPSVLKAGYTKDQREMFVMK